MMVMARVNMNDYTNMVLNVIKATFNLSDKSEALNKFAEIYGSEVVEKEPNEEYVKKVLEICNSHYKKYGQRKMSIKELDKLCEVE